MNESPKLSFHEKEAMRRSIRNWLIHVGHIIKTNPGTPAAREIIKEAMEICRPRHRERFAMYLHWTRSEPWGAIAKRFRISKKQLVNDVRDSGLAELYPLIPERFKDDSIKGKL